MDWVNIRPFPYDEGNDELAVPVQQRWHSAHNGGCQEYSALEDFDVRQHILDQIRRASGSSSDKYLECMQPQGPATLKQCGELMIQTPNSNYCLLILLWTRPGRPRGCSSSLMVFLAYLIYLADVCRMSRVDDEKVISTADYAVQISGLDKTLEADELLGRLQDELEEIDGGSFAGKVHHIEVGRHCG